MRRADEDLRRTAQEILNELDRAAARQGMADTESDSIDTVFDQSDINRINSVRKRYIADDTTATGGELLPTGEAEAPRMTRRQFLAQRLERRRTRSLEDGGNENTETVFEDVLHEDELTDTGMPARLSEVYRRDARRYDSPFERY